MFPPVELRAVVPFRREYEPIQKFDSTGDNGEMTACHPLLFSVADAVRGTGGLRHALPRAAFRVVTGAPRIRGFFPASFREVVIDMNAQLSGQPQLQFPLTVIK